MQRRRVRPPVQVANCELRCWSYAACSLRDRQTWPDRAPWLPRSRAPDLASSSVDHPLGSRSEPTATSAMRRHNGRADLAAGYRLIAAWTGPMPQRHPIRPRGRPCADPSALVSLARVHSLRGRSCRIRSLVPSTWTPYARCSARRPTMCTLEHVERLLTTAASCIRAPSSSRRRFR